MELGPATTNPLPVAEALGRFVASGISFQVFPGTGVPHLLDGLETKALSKSENC